MKVHKNNIGNCGNQKNALIKSTYKELIVLDYKDCLMCKSNLLHSKVEKRLTLSNNSLIMQMLAVLTTVKYIARVLYVFPKT